MISGVSTRPIAIRIRHPINPLIIPTIALPNTIEDVWSGHSIISSKLEWKSLWIMIFWADEVNPAVIDVIAMMPGIE